MKDMTDRACELGDGQACRSIGWWHVMGEQGRARDIKRATAHFEAGCAKGEPTSCLDLASLYDWAEFGFPENKTAARDYYKRACDLEFEMGCQHLADATAAAR
jgi:TPR repeat protein